MFFRILSLAPFLGKAISFFRFFETKRNRYLEERASETYGRRIRQESRNNRWRMFLEGDDEWERDYSAEVFWRKKKKKKEGKRKRKKSCSPIEAPFLSIHSSCPSPALSISFHRDTKIVSSGPTELEGFLRPTKGCTSQ